MKFRIERTLKIKDGNFSWAEYHWEESTGLWRYRRCSEGFFRRYILPTAFTDHERLLLEIKMSEQ